MTHFRVKRYTSNCKASIHVPLYVHSGVLRSCYGLQKDFYHSSYTSHFLPYLNIAEINGM